MKKCEKINKDELLSLIKAFEKIYDLVRIVEPETTTVLDLDGEDFIKKHKEPCFSIWEKDQRCDNCISLRACNEGQRMFKFEFRNEEIYSVVAMPFIVVTKKVEKKISLELVNQVTETTVFNTHGTGHLTNEVRTINKKIYEDSLTGAYNRRYYDEKKYIYETSSPLPKTVAFLVIDINKFKHINDTFGHVCGDELLVEIANMLKRNVRKSDNVIRIGGDEFLVVMKNCPRILVEKKIMQFKQAATKISLEWMGLFRPSVAVGMAFSNTFDGSEKNVNQLFLDADNQMYENKNMPYEVKKKMLIVDDVEINRDVLHNFFKDEFQVYQAKDGIEALEILETYPIEIVITDIFMPRMDGITLIKEIRGKKEIKNMVIFVVTERGEKLELEALEAGADDFINKPFNPELLNHRIKGVLAQNTVLSRISQHRLSFNQNQIPFATIKVDNENIIYEYVNEAFAALMGGTTDDYISGARQLGFKGLIDFLGNVSKTHERSQMDVYDDITGKYYSMVAYAQDNEFCSFILIRNDAMSIMKVSEERYETQFDNLLTINPNTLGAIFVKLKAGVCEKGYGSSKFFDKIKFPMNYEQLYDIFIQYAASEVEKNQLENLFKRENLLTAYSLGQRSIRMEAPFKVINGTTRWLGVYVKLSEPDNDGEIDAIFFAVDIHDRKLSQLVIDTVSRRNFDTLFCVDIAANTAQVYMGDGNVYWSNPMAVTQMDREIEKYLRVYYHEEDRQEFIENNRIPKIIEKMQDKDSYTVKYSLLDDDGKIYTKVGNYYWLDSSKSILCFAREDITEIIEKEQTANKNLAKTNEELIKASNAKMEFLSRMSHDIRTPMNTIIGLTSLAVDEINNPEKMMEYINNINSSSKFLLGLVNDILDMSKIESGMMNFVYEPYSYPDFLDTLYMMFKPMCEEKEINLVFERPKKAVVVMTDKTRINQVFFNILSNAVKYTNRGGTITYSTENLKMDADKISCDFIITDTGIGISEEFQREMFKEFAQEDRLKSSEVQSTGLGLPITKSVVELMGGTISIASKLNQGTKVTIHLTLPLSKNIQKTQMPKDVSALDEALLGKKILLVEDHPLNQIMTTKILEKKGMIVFRADNGQEALNAFKASEPATFDAILMDIRMPLLDGLAATKKIRDLPREDGKTIPIIAMTANAYTEDIEKTKKAGMDAHLTKPIDNNKLYETIGKLMMKN